MRRPVVLLTLALLIVSMVAVPSFAAGEQGRARAAEVAAPHANVLEAGYWTPQRLASAQDISVLRRAPDGRIEPMAPPADKPGKGNGGGGDGGDGGGGGGPVGDPDLGDGTAVGGADWTDTSALVHATLGKVYFTLNGRNYQCSGTAVDSPSGDLVLTAGHCVAERKKYASNVVFIPDFDPDGASYGTWAASTLITTREWQRGDFEGDAAFIVLAEKNGQSLTDVVGGQAIAFNRPRGEHAYSFGYPAASPYDGDDLTYCSGLLRDDPYGATTQGMTCNMTGGSSGGGWMASFDATAGTGVLTSVNSYKYTNDGSTMYGPYFGSTIESLYTTAESLGTP